MQNSAISFSVCINNDEKKIPQLIEALKTDYKVKENQGVELFTISNYDEKSQAQFSAGKKILVEQKTRNTLQWVLGV